MTADETSKPRARSKMAAAPNGAAALKPPQFELSLQAGQQGFVRRRTGDPLDQPLHRRLRRHLTQAASQSIDAVQLLWLEELLLSARSTRTDIDRGINA